MVENKNYTVFSGTGACTKLAFFEQKISSAFCRAQTVDKALLLQGFAILLEPLF